MSMTPFSSVLDAFQPDGDGFGVDVPEDWLQGRTLYGGLSTALSYEAAIRSHDALPPLRSAMVSFVGPASGPVRVVSTILRQGRSTAFVNVDLAGEKGLAVRTVFCFGAPRPSAFEASVLTPPTFGDPETTDPFFPPGVGPSFAQHYDSRLIRGGRPVSGSTDNVITVWSRHRDDQARTSMTALLALADVLPPVIMQRFTQPAPISSMTWMINVLCEEPVTEDGWWLCDVDLEQSGAGYSSQNMGIWNRDGVPTLISRQSVAVFA